MQPDPFRSTVGDIRACLEALREADRLLDAAPRTQRAELRRVREVERAHATGPMRLREEHLLRRTVLRTPVAEPSLQRAQLPRVELAGVSSLQLGEDRLRLEPAVEIRLEQRHDLRRPHLRERILARPPISIALRLRRQRARLPRPRAPLAHARRRCRCCLCLAFHPLPPQQADLRVGDHLDPVLGPIQHHAGALAQATSRAVRIADGPANLVVVDRQK
ncbi:MAG: hypothetical protein IPH07_18410 [Deltaproteobacteria bacterium]|nr:hypothetical protein [Deltaproteobacteria bacterium]MBK8715675.1 hypothetical protein [Deltaproteobacteria bacterium]